MDSDPDGNTILFQLLLLLFFTLMNAFFCRSRDGGSLCEQEQDPQYGGGRQQKGGRDSEPL